jgi:hypothetical protein
VDQPKPVWWKVIVGILIVLTEGMAILNRQPIAASANRDQVEGMNAMQVVLVVVGLWLIWSGTKPLRR